MRKSVSVKAGPIQADASFSITPSNRSQSPSGGGGGGSGSSKGGGGGGGDDKSFNSRKLPYTNLKFWVQIQGINVAGFTDCSAISVETELYEYNEGGLNTYTHKLPVRSKYGNITLKHGLDPDEDLLKWYRDSMDGLPQGRKDISIILYKPNGEVAKQWDLLGAFPVKWTSPDFKADTAAGAIEILELAHRGFNPSTNSR